MRRPRHPVPLPAATSCVDPHMIRSAMDWVDERCGYGCWRIAIVRSECSRVAIFEVSARPRGATGGRSFNLLVDELGAVSRVPDDATAQEVRDMVRLIARRVEPREATG